MDTSLHPSRPQTAPDTMVLPQRVTCPNRHEPVLAYVTLSRYDHQVCSVWCERAHRGCKGDCGRLVARRFGTA